MTVALRPTTHRRGRQVRALGARGLRLVILLGFAYFCLVPLVWLLFAATKTQVQILEDPPLSFGAFENIGIAWSNLTSYNNGVIYQWLGNTVVYTLLTLVLTVFTALLAGYALAALRVPFRKSILFLTLMAMVVPPSALVLPLFLELNAVGLTGTMWSVILPSSFFPFGVYLSFIYFATSLPKDLLEASRLDGCSEFRIFREVALPLAKPLVGLVSFFSFTANWNNYFLPYVMLTDEALYNLPLGMGALIAGTGALSMAGGVSTLPIHQPEIALVGVITVLPIALLFLVAQRYLVRGILAGSVNK